MVQAVHADCTFACCRRVINGVKLLTKLLPRQYAAFVPMCIVGWLVEHELLPMRRLNKLKGFRAGILRRLGGCCKRSSVYSVGGVQYVRKDKFVVCEVVFRATLCLLTARVWTVAGWFW